MKIRKIMIAAVGMMAIGLQSCGDWLSVQPIDRQTEDQLYATKGGFYTALNGVYNQMSSKDLYGQNLSYGTISILERRYVVPSDNAVSTAIAAGNYADKDVAAIFDNIWSNGYRTILSSNIVLRNCEEKKGAVLSERDYNLIKGEVLAIRAMMHFDLFRLFGPIYKNAPEAKSLPYNDVSYAQTLPILTANKFLERVMDDLNMAEQLLAVSDPILTDGVQNTPITDIEADLVGQTYRYRQLRLNYFAVLALKARVLLYKGDNPAALAAAKKVIEHPQRATLFPFVEPATLLGNTTTPDRVFSTESLFGFYNSDRGLIYKERFTPASAATYNLLQPRKDYVMQQMFKNETSDYRYLSQWEKSTTAGNSMDVLNKYKEIIEPANTNKRFYGTFFPLIRLSEMYYIAAECETDFAMAKEYFNTIRSKRGITTSTTAANQSALNTLINNEYNREFAGEGQLFFLYKRLFLAQLPNENGSSTAGFAATEARMVIPMPKSEVGIR